MSPADTAKGERGLLARWAVVRLAAVEADPRHARDHDLIALLRAQAVVLLAPGPVDVAALDELGTGEDLESLRDTARRWLAAGAPLGDPWAGTPRPVAMTPEAALTFEARSNAGLPFYFPDVGEDSPPTEEQEAERERAREREQERLAALGGHPVTWDAADVHEAAAGTDK